MFEALFGKKKEPIQQAATLPDGMSFFVTGVEYRMDNLILLATEQKRFKMPVEKLTDVDGKKLFRYYFKNEPVELIPEPTNPHDPDAIKVQIAGQHIGYVPRTDTKMVKMFLDAGVSKLSAIISGGEYKIVKNGIVTNYSDPIQITIRVYRSK